MKKLILPVAIIGLAVGAAYATQKAQSSAMVPAIGHRIGNVGENPCEVTPKQCDTQGAVTCTWFDITTGMTHDLKLLSGTSCEQPLYEP